MKRIAPKLSDHALDRALSTVVANERAATVIVLDHIAEYERRKLFRPAGCSSMFAYCTDRLHLSDAAAIKRIRAARAACRFPVIFDMVADGRQHLSGVVLLAPYLTESTAAELLAAATHQTTKAIERLLAERFPRPDLPTEIRAIPGPATVPAGPDELTLKSVNEIPQGSPGGAELTLRSVDGPVISTQPEDRPRMKPLAPQRFALQVTIDEETHDGLRYAQELLSHELPAGDVAAVLKMAIQALIPQVEKRRFAATETPRPGTSTKSLRHIPAHVRREVWRRDGGQCTFVSEDGHRCSERKFIQFDHALEAARGGEASVAQVRLRCYAHNQYTAERTFGTEFMRHKRIAAAEKRAAAP